MGRFKSGISAVALMAALGASPLSAEEKKDWAAQFWAVALPANLTATLVLPSAATGVLHNGKAVTGRTIRVTGGKHLLEAKLLNNR